MTRLELANQLIENQPAFHFAFIPVIVVRVQRFAPLTKLVLSQPPLPIGLHAQELRISDFELRICFKLQTKLVFAIRASVVASSIRNPKFAIRNSFGTRGGIRTHTVQILNLSSPASWTTRAKGLQIFDCQLPIYCLDRTSMLRTHQSAIDNWQSAMLYLVPAEGFEPTLSSS